MSQESDVCCTTSMYDIQNRCILDEIDLFYFKTCIITHNNNVIEQNINVFMFVILSVERTSLDMYIQYASRTDKHFPGKTFVIWDKKGQLKDLGIWTLESAKEVITENSSVL